VSGAEGAGAYLQDGPVLGFRLGQPAEPVQGNPAEVTAVHRHVVLRPKDPRGDIAHGAEFFLGRRGLAQPNAQMRPDVDVLRALPLAYLRSGHQFIVDQRG
jgi:hypothetical protein